MHMPIKYSHALKYFECARVRFFVVIIVIVAYAESTFTALIQLKMEFYEHLRTV